MEAAVHVSVFVAGGVRQALDDGARLLRRGGVVEIDQRLTVGALGENWKVGAQSLDVERQARLVSDEFVHATISLRRISAMKFLPQVNFAPVGPSGATSRQDGVTRSID